MTDRTKTLDSARRIADPDADTGTIHFVADAKRCARALLAEALVLTDMVKMSSEEEAAVDRAFFKSVEIVSPSPAVRDALEDCRRIDAMSAAWGDPAGCQYQEGDGMLVKRVRDLLARYHDAVRGAGSAATAWLDKQIEDPWDSDDLPHLRAIKEALYAGKRIAPEYTAGRMSVVRDVHMARCAGKSQEEAFLIELKNCPFCGETPAITEHVNGDHEQDGLWWINCETIGCIGPCSDVGPRNSVSADWNRRPPSWQEAIEAAAKDGRTVLLRGEMLAHYMPGAKFSMMPAGWRPETPQTEWRLTGWREVTPSNDQAAVAQSPDAPKEE